MKQLHCYAALCLTLTLSSVLAAGEPASFADATRAPYSPPPAESINGNSIAEMKTKVESLWEKIVFEKSEKKNEYVVTLKTEAGDVHVELWPDVAPNHARSFIALAQAGFYDGLIFHRVIPGFMIQGGCPQGNGTGGPGYCVKAEFNERPHKRGVLSMARAKPPDSAGSQFFVCVAEASFLDNKYTAFGMVTDGMKVVDKIVGAKRNAMDRPLEPVKIIKATVTIKGE